MMTKIAVASIVLLMAATPRSIRAQTPGAPGPVAASPTSTPTTAVTPPPGYVIGANDVLTIVFWRDKELSGDVVVRPDGKISLPLLNDVQAAGLAPDQLRAALADAAGNFIEQPTVAVVVKEINSLKVFITGEIEKPGAYPLTSPMTVMQLIALAGGFREFADKKHLVVMRVEDGRQYLFPFNYDALSKRRQVRDNMRLKPGDTVIVP